MPRRKSKLAGQLELIHPDPKKHAEALFDMTGKVFSRANEYYGWIEMCRRTYFGRGHYDWKASRIGLLDGRIVTHWGVWGYRIRIGRAVVRCAGIGDVATDGNFRCHGLMGATGRAAMKAMRARGYDLSILFGRPNFYDRFGYCRAWPGHHWTVGVADLPADKPREKLRRHRESDLPEMDRLYNRTHAGLTGTVVHPTVRHEHLTPPHHCTVWGGSQNRPAGYVIHTCGNHTMNVTESAGDAGQVLRAIGLLARRNHCDNAAFLCLHYESDLSKRLRRGCCADNVGYTRRGGQMIATVNLRSTLEKLSRELARRLKGSVVEGWRGVLTMADQNDTVSLKISRGKVSVVDAARSRHAIRGRNEIAQLLIGTHDLVDTVESAGIRLTGDARKLAAVLFPDQHPMQGMRDHF